MHGRPVIAELELRDARGRGVKRPDPDEAETERFQDQNAYGDAVSDHAHHLIAVTGPEPLETAQHALAHLAEGLGARRSDEVRRLRPALVEHGGTPSVLVQAATIPRAATQD